tara:strand:- start:1286 stop:1747 length:462 start_codon:yes stop_codon:yes gene_type:complete
MNKYKKVFIMVLLLALSNCGYNRIYTNNSIQDIRITISELKGDKEFSNKIYRELKPYFNVTSDKEYELIITADFKKEIVTKDIKGDISVFNLIAEVGVDVNHINKQHTLFFSENLKINNKNNSFEQREYEDNVKKNFARSIKEKLISKLRILK